MPLGVTWEVCTTGTKWRGTITYSYDFSINCIKETGFPFQKECVLWKLVIECSDAFNAYWNNYAHCKILVITEYVQSTVCFRQYYLKSDEHKIKDEYNEILGEKSIKYFFNQCISHW